MQNEVLYFGLRFSELLTLVGIIIGPIAAVIITLATEAKRRQRDAKIQIMRMLINTRHLPGDPLYSTAINLIPIEFNRDRKVMSSWNDYINHVRIKPSSENAQAHNILIVAKQTSLIFHMMKSLGFNLSETDIQTSAYASEGSIIRDNLYLDSLNATKRIADALELQTSFIQNTADSKTALTPKTRKSR